MALSTYDRRARVEEAIPEWLYKACDLALRLRNESTHYTDRADLDDTLALEALIDTSRGRYFVAQYPPRPCEDDFEELEAMVDESEAVETLLELVDDYPYAEDVHVGSDSRLSVHDDMPSGASWFELSSEFKHQVMECLEDVEREVGIEAREVANWMIRDKHAERVSGIDYAGSGRRLGEWSYWKDESAMWLK
ncbi:hypothetical protein PM082_005592 [Marasmius tenuissimus]|nr:hypothetical protein PM082_005592 [Marasmius tenuissimus]